MKLIFATLAILVACSSAASILDRSLAMYWTDYKQAHGKSYSSIKEELLRRSIWESNLKKINEHNLAQSLGKYTYTLKMNKFGDLTNEEFRRSVNGFNQKTKTMTTSSGNARFLAPSNIKLPSSVDWRKEGYVTPIKDQGQCGSCWSFSAVASLEGQHFKQTGKLVSLSEQNLIDCSANFGNQGCDGGLMDQAFQYIKANNGIDTEQSYPYEAQDGDCRFNEANVGATDSGLVDIDPQNETALTLAVATVGPISVAIDASQESFQFYSSGVYSEASCSSTELDHGVAVVGYGTKDGKDYYIVKNSWGTNWGDAGYILMARNQNNMCGIATMASYPTV